MHESYLHAEEDHAISQNSTDFKYIHEKYLHPAVHQQSEKTDSFLLLLYYITLADEEAQVLRGHLVGWKERKEKSNGAHAKI